PALVHFPGTQFFRRRPMVLHCRLSGLCLRPSLRETHERRFFGHRRRDAGGVPRPLLDFEQKAGTGSRAELTQRPKPNALGPDQRQTRMMSSVVSLAAPPEARARAAET